MLDALLLQKKPEPAPDIPVKKSSAPHNLQMFLARNTPAKYTPFPNSIKPP